MAKIQTVSIAASRRLEVFQKKILINAKILKKKQKKILNTELLQECRKNFFRKQTESCFNVFCKFTRQLEQQKVATILYSTILFKIAYTKLTQLENTFPFYHKCLKLTF